MKTTRFIDEVRHDLPKQSPTSEEHALLIEIAERFHQLGRSRPTIVTALIRQSCHVLNDSDTAFWLLWDAMRSQSEWRSTSYSKLAANRGCTKQAIHQRLEADTEIIALRKPSIAAIIRERIGRRKKPAKGQSK